MGFAAPWFFAGLSALVVPLYVHLLRQHKTTPLNFSSLMFFEARTQSSVKHRRLKYLALLALRIASVVLLSLTFANFFVSCSTPPSARSRLTVVAVDRSLSMKAGDRMQAAKSGAASVIQKAPGAVQVIAFDSSVSLLTQSGVDKTAARTALAGVDAGDGRSSYGAVARAIASIANASGAAVEAHVFTDLQKSSLPSPFSDLALPGNAKLTVHPVADKPEPNWFVESVTAPRQVFRADKLRVQATIAGAGTADGDLPVSLSVNGKQAGAKTVHVPANGRASVEFMLPEAAHGFNRGEVRIDAHDALAQDNSFPFAIDRREAGRVLFAGDPRSALYYRSALESLPDAGLVVDQVNADQLANLDLGKYALVVLTSPPPASDNLARYLSAGGGLLVALGPASVAQGRVPVSGERILDSRYAPCDGDRFQTAASVDESHPVLARANRLEGVKFYQAIRIDPGNARVLAKLVDGTPLLIERRIGEGRVLIFASTLDNVANDFPLHASFVPFIEASARYLAGFDDTPRDYLVGSTVDLRNARDSHTAVEVLDAAGKPILGLAESARAETFLLPREGFFEIRRANGRDELIAAHADRRESDLDIIPAETLALWQNTGSGQTAAGAASPDSPERRESLWWYFALALFLLSLAESFFSSRYLAAETDKPVFGKVAA
jgi:hypothetical protein